VPDETEYEVIKRPATAPSGNVLVLGLGNPILGDDGIGWRVAEDVRRSVTGLRHAIDVDCASVGGLSLMERMLGYRRVILVDSMWTGNHAAGTVHEFGLDELSNPDAGHTSSAHDTSLTTALRAAAAMGAEVPTEVRIVGIETPACYEFTEALSPAAQSALPIATRKVIELIEAAGAAPP
jgi:hydrogenase maturation protease